MFLQTDPVLKGRWNTVGGKRSAAPGPVSRKTSPEGAAELRSDDRPRFAAWVVFPFPGVSLRSIPGWILPPLRGWQRTGTASVQTETTGTGWFAVVRGRWAAGRVVKITSSPPSWQGPSSQEPPSSREPLSRPPSSQELSSREPPSSQEPLSSREPSWQELSLQPSSSPCSLFPPFRPDARGGQVICNEIHDSKHCPLFHRCKSERTRAARARGSSGGRRLREWKGHGSSASGFAM